MISTSNRFASLSSDNSDKDTPSEVILISNNICCKDYQWISKTLSRWKVTVFIKIKQNLVNEASSE